MLLPQMMAGPFRICNTIIGSLTWAPGTFCAVSSSAAGVESQLSAFPGSGFFTVKLNILIVLIWPGCMVGASPATTALASAGEPKE